MTTANSYGIPEFEPGEPTRKPNVYDELANTRAELEVCSKVVFRKNEQINELIIELEACKFQLSAFDSQFLKPSDKTLNWQGINKECKGWQDRAEKAETELEALREKVKEYFSAKQRYMQTADWWNGDSLDIAESQLRAAVEKGE